MQSRLHRILLTTLPAFCLFGAAAAQQAIGTLYASDASVRGSVMLVGSGTSVLSGSSIEAGRQPATLKLERGGSLLVCEGTKLSINSSQNGREMMFSLNSGNLELNYPLGTEADTLLTPDLRLLLPGPGTVHVAVRVEPQGDTCVQSLSSNASAIVISESMGDATYQVKPDEAVLFRAGHLSEATRSRQNCGCPTPPQVEVAKAAPPALADPKMPLQNLPVLPAPAAVLASAPPPAPRAEAPADNSAKPPEANEPHLAVEAPFIFHGDDAMPDMREMVVMLKLESAKKLQMEPTVLPPSAKANETQVAKKQSHHFLSKVGAFFASIFH